MNSLVLRVWRDARLTVERRPGLDRREPRYRGQPRRTPLPFEVRVCPKRIISPSVFWFSLKCDPSVPVPSKAADHHM